MKRYKRWRVANVVRRVVRGTEARVGARLMETQRCADAVINTTYI
jgi:hypothetical protein